MKKDMPWSVKMADAVLERFAELPPSWSHEYGAVFLGLIDIWRKTGDKRYFDFVKRHIDAVVGPNGEITGYDRSRYRLDDIISGRLLFPLFDETGDERYRTAARTLRDHFRSHPRTTDGGFWHNGELPNQMLLDGIYMGAPFYAEYAKRENDAEGLDDAIRQPLLLVEHSRDGASGLFYHGWNEDKKQSWANSETGCSPSFWGRALGWYAMALTDLLGIVPESHPRYAELLAAYKDLMRALVAVQDPGSGLWWHVLDQGAREGNYLEASASLMFLRALAEGVAKGYLPEDPYRVAADRAFAGATGRLVGDDGGLPGVKNVCKTAGLGVRPGRDGSFAYYISEPIVDNDLKGFAGFLLAASAYESL